MPSITPLPTDVVATYSLATRYWIALILAAVCVLCAWWILRSRLGLCIVALREDEQAAAASGVGSHNGLLVVLAFPGGLIDAWSRLMRRTRRSITPAR